MSWFTSGFGKPPVRTLLVLLLAPPENCRPFQAQAIRANGGGNHSRPFQPALNFLSDTLRSVVTADVLGGIAQGKKVL